MTRSKVQLAGLKSIKVTDLNKLEVEAYLEDFTPIRFTVNYGEVMERDSKELSVAIEDLTSKLEEIFNYILQRSSK